MLAQGLLLVLLLSMLCYCDASAGATSMLSRFSGRSAYAKWTYTPSSLDSEASAPAVETGIAYIECQTPT